MGTDLERIAGPLERLYGAGALSKLASKALEIPGVRGEIVRGLGSRSDANELLLATILIDDSLSIAPNLAEIRNGHNLMLDVLREKPTGAEARVYTRALNRGVMSAYQPIAQAMALDNTNFNGDKLSPLGTPLYRQSLITLGTVLVKAQEEEDRGASVRTFTLIITDAEDNRSYDVTAENVGFVVTDMLEFATNHIVAGMGIGEREHVNFREVFLSMGIPERFIFTPGATKDDLRAVFQQIAGYLHRAASSEDEFLQLAGGS